MMDWQPIETAPRDGRELLLWSAKLPSDPPSTYRWLPKKKEWVATHTGENILFYDARCGEHKFEYADFFTHWLPVPPSPPNADTTNPEAEPPP